MSDTKTCEWCEAPSVVGVNNRWACQEHIGEAMRSIGVAMAAIRRHFGGASDA